MFNQDLVAMPDSLDRLLGTRSLQWLVDQKQYDLWLVCSTPWNQAGLTGYRV